MGGINYFDSANLLSQFFDAAGDGVSDNNLNGDYSGAPTIFKYKAPVGMVAHIVGISIVLEATGNFAYDEYVPGSELINGITLEHDTSLGVRPIPTNEPLKVLGAYQIIGTGGTSTTFNTGNATNFARYEIGFTKLHVNTLDLNGSDGHEFRIILNDDFRGLNVHLFMAHGFLTKVDG